MALFAATLGAQIVTGAIWAPLAGLLPMEGARAAFLAFAAGSAAICVALWLLSLVVAGAVALARLRAA